MEKVIDAFENLSTSVSRAMIWKYLQQEYGAPDRHHQILQRHIREHRS